MMEIEARVKIDDIDNLKEKLSNLGATFLKKRKEIDEYFSLKNRDFWSTLECLRIRQLPETNDAILTYKPSTTEEMKKKEMFYKEELEVEVNAALMRKILIALECIPLITVEKEREYWEIDNKKIMIDKVKDLGNFMEVEVNHPEKEIDESREIIFKFFKDLGFDLDRLTSEPYRCMLRKVRQWNSAKNVELE